MQNVVDGMSHISIRKAIGTKSLPSPPFYFLPLPLLCLLSFSSIFSPPHSPPLKVWLHLIQLGALGERLFSVYYRPVSKYVNK